MVTLALLLSASITPLENCFPGLEIVEQQDTVNAQGAGDFLHRLDMGSHGLTGLGIRQSIQEATQRDSVR